MKGTAVHVPIFQLLGGSDIFQNELGRKKEAERKIKYISIPFLLFLSNYGCLILYHSLTNFLLTLKLNKNKNLKEKEKFKRRSHLIPRRTITIKNK